MNDEFILHRVSIMKNVKSLEQSQNAKRVNLAAWRASRLHELTLPSGLTVTVRNCDMTDLIIAGKLPNAVLDHAEMSAVEGKSEVDLQKISLELMKKNGPEFVDFLNVITRASLVEPLIGDVADDTHITIGELDIADKTAIMAWVNREVPSLQTFREGQNEPVASVQHGDGLQQASK